MSDICAAFVYVDQYCIWTDGLSALLGKELGSDLTRSDLDTLMSMEMKLRLLDLENITIPEAPPPVPKEPSTYNFTYNYGWDVCAFSQCLCFLCLSLFRGEVCHLPVTKMVSHSVILVVWLAEEWNTVILSNSDLFEFNMDESAKMTHSIFMLVYVPENELVLVTRVFFQSFFSMLVR